MSMFSRRRTPSSDDTLEVSSTDGGLYVPRFGGGRDGRPVEVVDAVGTTPADRAVVNALVESASKGALQTAPGNVFELTPPERDVCAYFSGGIFVISDPRGLDPAVDALWTAVWSRSHSVTQIVRVAPASLARLYHAAAGAGVSSVTGVAGAEQWLTDMLVKARDYAASDVHLACDPNGVRAALRVDGMLEQVTPPSRSLAESVLRVLPSLADRPSDATLGGGGALQCSGRRFALPEAVGALRVRIARLAGGGAQAVIRVFGPWSGASGSGLDGLGYLRVHREALFALRESGPGLLVVAGPTGAGKSTALRALIGALGVERVPAPLVVTAESPVEVVLPGVRQLDVPPGARALCRALSRLADSDPDVLVVGESRGNRVFRAVVDAAGGGLSLWTTLHASDARGAVAKLCRAAAHEADVRAVLAGVVAQRLVPVLCTSCSFVGNEARDALSKQSPVCLSRLESWAQGRVGSGMLSAVRVRRRGAHSCSIDDCRRGVLARTVVAEVVVGPRVLPVGPSLAEHGLMRVLSGLLDPVDAMRVTGIPSHDPQRHAQLETLLRTESSLS